MSITRSVYKRRWFPFLIISIFLAKQSPHMMFILGYTQNTILFFCWLECDFSRPLWLLFPAELENWSLSCIKWRLAGFLVFCPCCDMNIFSWWWHMASICRWPQPVIGLSWPTECLRLDVQHQQLSFLKVNFKGTCSWNLFPGWHVVPWRGQVFK